MRYPAEWEQPQYNGPIQPLRVLFGDQQHQGLSIAPTVANNTGDSVRVPILTSPWKAPRRMERSPMHPAAARVARADTKGGLS